MKKRIVLDPGHGGTQPGAVYSGLKEKDVVLEVAKYAVEALELLDPEIWVGLTRSFDQTVSLQQRCVFANNMKADCFASLHCNADLDDDSPGQIEAKGEEIWIYNQSKEGLKLAQCLQTEVDRIFPDEPFRGIKTTNTLYVLKHTKAPACLLELGFIDKSSSMETFVNELTLRKIGALVARGIYEYLKGE